MKLVFMAALPLIAASACARFQPTTPATDYTPAATIQSFTLKNTAVHYDPSVLTVGMPRTAVEQAFGEPNATETTNSGQVQDVYAFNPDGTKYVNPQIRPRNIALGVFTMGASMAVRQARLGMAEKKLTLYHVLYTPEGRIQSVKEEKMPDAPPDGPQIQGQGAADGQ